MRRRLPTFAATSLVLLPLLLPGTALSAQQGGDFEWTGDVPDGGRLRVYSGNGPIEVEPADGDRIEILGERLPGYRDRDPVRFQIVEAGSDVVVCAVAEYAECGRDGLRTFERRRSHNPERVRFIIRVPPGVDVRLGTGNGEITIEGVGGDVVANTGNGDIHVRGTSGTVDVHSGNGALEIDAATGPVEARTGNGRITARTASGPVSAHSGNGDIRIEVGAVTGEGDLEFHTGSGDIELRLPADLDADFVARLGNGAVTSDFPMLIAGRTSFHNFRATIGQGGRRLLLSSGNGDAVLRRR